jgi:formylglycine-generating enzyme required for sulfatase activity
VLGGLGASGARREQRVTLLSFSIDRHEVTNRQYRLCAQANRCSRPLEPAEFEGYDWVDQDLPVIYLSAYQAASFCRWLGRRLPTGAEWERAARGTAGRPWPWGSADATPSRANLIYNQPTTTLARVHDDRFAAGSTPEGITGLVGNVAEWTSTPSTCKTAPYNCKSLWNGSDKVDVLEVHGHSYRSAAEPVTYYTPQEPLQAKDDVGFRCAHSE